MSLFSQVGIGNTSPEGALDVTSTQNGILIPRIALNSTTTAAPVVNPISGQPLVDGTMVWNTGTGGLKTTGYYYWENNKWNQIVSTNQSQVYFGKFIIDEDGNLPVTGVGFEPSAVEFIAVNRAQDYDDGAYRSSQNNSDDVRVAGGFTTGYANNSSPINQQVISSAFNGSSLNNIGTYSSDSHCLAAYFVDEDGFRLRDNGTENGGSANEDGLIRASLQSFNDDGFILNVDKFISGNGSVSNAIVVIYKAYR